MSHCMWAVIRPLETFSFKRMCTVINGGFLLSLFQPINNYLHDYVCYSIVHDHIDIMNVDLWKQCCLLNAIV